MLNFITISLAIQFLSQVSSDSLVKSSTIPTDVMTIFNLFDLVHTHRNHSKSVKSGLHIKNEHFQGIGSTFLGLFVTTE